MEYKALTGVWEITMGCNMRCKHCGSICETSLPGELTTEEALNLCDDLGKMDFRFITLSGGEPTIRKDWFLIAKRLSDNGIIPTMISNGWLLDEEKIDQAISSGVNTIAISLDGLEETHDFMRRENSFSRSMQGLRLMKEKGLPSSVITTINKKNINELPELMNILIEKGVNSWQLQIGLPMGNLAKNSELVITPEEIDQVIDFAYNNINDKRIKIFFADCIGYYNFKEIEVRKAFRGDDYMWCGCGAGKNNLGILHNGDIVACTSIRDKEFIEGNIRETSINEIWTNPNLFKWNREMSKAKLNGFCGKCAYGDICLGGCANTRLCTEKDIYKENKYCSYQTAIKKVQEKIDDMTDIEMFYSEAEKLAKENQHQIAGLLLEKLLNNTPDDIRALNLYGYVNFMLKNYEVSREANEKVLKLDNDNVYANKGIGLCLSKLTSLDEGLNFLKKSMKLTDKNFMDPYYDTAVLLIENNQNEYAASILLEAKDKSQEFYEANKDLYLQLEIC